MQFPGNLLVEYDYADTFTFICTVFNQLKYEHYWHVACVWFMAHDDVISFFSTFEYICAYDFFSVKNICSRQQFGGG